MSEPSRVFGDLEILELRMSEFRAWALFPYAAKRCADFCAKYDSDADPAEMVKQVQQAFMYPGQASLLVLLRDGRTVGHLLVTMENWFGTKMATVIQYETDEPVPRAVQMGWLEWFEDWARERGAKFFQCLTRNEDLARVFQRYGYKRERILMRKPLPTVVAGDVETCQTVTPSGTVRESQEMAEI